MLRHALPFDGIASLDIGNTGLTQRADHRLAADDPDGEDVRNHAAERAVEVTVMSTFDVIKRAATAREEDVMRHG